MHISGVLSLHTFLIFSATLHSLGAAVSLNTDLCPTKWDSQLYLIFPSLCHSPEIASNCKDHRLTSFVSFFLGIIGGSAVIICFLRKCKEKNNKILANLISCNWKFTIICNISPKFQTKFNIYVFLFTK